MSVRIKATILGAPTSSSRSRFSTRGEARNGDGEEANGNDDACRRGDALGLMREIDGLDAMKYGMFAGGAGDD